jgi:hypothetical protein
MDARESMAPRHGSRFPGGGPPVALQPEYWLVLCRAKRLAQGAVGHPTLGLFASTTEVLFLCKS